MKIRMYDCKFGDCFKIESEQVIYNPLIVDCGIHKSSLKKIPRSERYEKIAADVPEHVDFLLTHYHEDHYAGVIYMARHFSKKYENVYLPNVWNVPNSLSLVRTILLMNILNKNYVNSHLSLISFLKMICSGRSVIHFVKYGDTIQNQYNVLWPDMREISPPDDALEGYEEDFTSRLDTLTEKLIEIVLRVQETMDRGSEVYGQALEVFEDLEREYESLCDEAGPDKRKLSYLRDWENDISVVFRSSQTLKRRILFCGDVPSKYWKNIKVNISADNSTFYKKYDVIKVPHHGTKGYYNDFIDLSKKRTVWLITNGGHSGWDIYCKYSADSNYVGCKVMCSGKDACNVCVRNKCNCRRGTIIANDKLRFYYDI